MTADSTGDPTPDADVAAGSPGERRPAACADEAKRSLREAARAARIATPDRDRRSAAIVETLLGMPAVVSARRVLAYTAAGSEVDVSAFVDACRADGREVRFPEDDGIRADWADVVVVPGLAFTSDGRRCGQGAGWYDRFLPGRRADCVTIGVGFRTQLVDDVPTDVHDVVLDHVVTD